jgi:hypothetical protein
MKASGQVLYNLYVARSLNYKTASKRLQLYAEAVPEAERWDQLSQRQQRMWNSLAKAHAKALREAP